MSLESALRELNGGPKSHYANCNLFDRLYEARRTEGEDRRVLVFNGTWTDLELSPCLRNAPTISKVLVFEGKINGKDGNDLRGQLCYYPAWSREQMYKPIAELLAERESHLSKQKRRTELLKKRQPLPADLDDASLDYNYADEGFIESAVIEARVWVPTELFNDLRTANLRIEQISLNLELIPENKEAFSNVAVIGYSLLWMAELASTVRIEAFHFHIKDQPVEVLNEKAIAQEHSSAQQQSFIQFEIEILSRLSRNGKNLIWCLFILMSILLAIIFKK